MIEVGEYVRLARNHGINKIIDKENDRYFFENEIEDSECNIAWFLYEFELKEEIVKHSKQLIDLIEVRDILKYRIKGLELSFTGIVHEKFDNRKGEYYKIINEHNLNEIEIEQILTHEQFKANCYKVGGDKKDGENRL